ncbi:hypothetical protein AAHE18_03G011400 [Arachis hypogaea]
MRVEAEVFIKTSHMHIGEQVFISNIQHTKPYIGKKRRKRNQFNYLANIQTKQVPCILSFFGQQPSITQQNEFFKTPTMKGLSFCWKGINFSQSTTTLSFNNFTGSEIVENLISPFMF